MESYLIIFWMLIFAGALIVEISTTALVSIWFCAGALAALAACLLHAPVWLQAVLFASVSVLLFMILRKKLAHYFLWNAGSQNPYAGKTGIVTQEITAQVPGRILLEGKDWRASGWNSLSFEKGEKVTVVLVKGATLYVTKHTENNPVRY